jgi:hypothetical protein
MELKEFAEFAATFVGLLTALIGLLAGGTGILKASGELRKVNAPRGRTRALLIAALAVAGLVVAGALGLLTARMFPTVFGASVPTLRLTMIPRASTTGDPLILETIEGVVEGVLAPQNYRVVIYAKTNRWYVQPDETERLIHINPDGKFSSAVRLGIQYAVLLVNPTYNPPIMAEAIPGDSADILVLKTYEGRK